MPKLLILLVVVSIQSWATSLKVPLDYPEEAIKNCIEGWVKIEYEVSSDYKPINITVIESEPGEVFDQSAISNVAKWQVKEAVGTVKVTELEFKLDDHSHCNS